MYRIVLEAYTNPVIHYIPTKVLNSILRGYNLDPKKDKKEVQDWIFNHIQIIQKESVKKEKVHFVC
ncbi:MAG: hypothetical protein QXP36_02025 [Conexivisphaerales archaeon]